MKMLQRPFRRNIKQPCTVVLRQKKRYKMAKILLTKYNVHYIPSSGEVPTWLQMMCQRYTLEIDKTKSRFSHTHWLLYNVFLIAT